MSRRELGKVGHPSLLLHTTGLTLAFCGAGMLLSALVELLMSRRSEDWVPLLVLGALTAAVGVGHHAAGGRIGAGMRLIEFSSGT